MMVYRFVVAVILAVPLAVSGEGDKSEKRWFKQQPPLTDAQRAAFANRTAIFQWLPPETRPDLDWRSVLHPRLANENPKWSQGFEELIIRDFFGDREGGFYVDVGCFLPRDNSTTYVLESEFGWTGIGIDAIGKYKHGWAVWRPSAEFVEAAVSDKDGETLTLHVAGSLATLNGEVIDRAVGRGRKIEVETITLNTLLERRNVTKIDFLSMDIEGAEPAALAGFDIQRYKPDLCCVESIASGPVGEYFNANGYELIEKYRKVDKVNLYYRPKSSG